MARACGNFRVFPNEAESDHEHADWLAGARAIIERDQLRTALVEISKGEGRFNRDPLIHASNTIEDMKRIALAALI